MKRKKWAIAAGVLAAVVLLGLLGHRQIFYLSRELSYRFGQPSETEQTVHAFAKDNRVAYGAYPQALIDLLETNPETEDFVLNYPIVGAVPMDLSAYHRDSVPLFLQWDPMWGYETYGSSYLAVTGCGPTCCAMVGYYLTGDPSMNPGAIAAFAQANGYYKTGYGSSWTLISEGLPDLGLAVTELPLVEKKIRDALDEGNPVIVALGPGDFTTSGHYIVLTSAEETGFRVNDPNSRIRSEQIWSYDTLAPQIRNLWAVSKP